MHCICGHSERAHVAGGRCRVPDCPCERFEPGDTVENAYQGDDRAFGGEPLRREDP